MNESSSSSLATALETSQMHHDPVEDEGDKEMGIIAGGMDHASINPNSDAMMSETVLLSRHADGPVSSSSISAESGLHLVGNNHQAAESLSTTMNHASEGKNDESVANNNNEEHQRDVQMTEEESDANAQQNTQQQNNETSNALPSTLYNHPDDKRKRNALYLNSRPRFNELNNDVLLCEVWDALHKGQNNWLTAKDVLVVLEFGRLMRLGARAPVRPPSGSIFYFDSRAGEYFRRDGYDYVKKKGSGVSVREDHVKLRQGSVAVVYASYVHSAEWVDSVSGASLFHRRSYWLVDSDEKTRGVVVHYLGNADSGVEPVNRPHDVACECVLCCLKRENSRPDRPGESLEQIISRVQLTTRTRKKRVSSSGNVAADSSSSLGNASEGASSSSSKQQQIHHQSMASSSFPTITTTSGTLSSEMISNALLQQQEFQMRKKRKGGKGKSTTTTTTTRNLSVSESSADVVSSEEDDDDPNDESSSDMSSSMSDRRQSSSSNLQPQPRTRDVPRRAAAPSQPLLEDSSSDDDEEEEDGGGDAHARRRGGKSAASLANGGRSRVGSAASAHHPTRFPPVVDVTSNSGFLAAAAAAGQQQQFQHEFEQQHSPSLHHQRGDQTFGDATISNPNQWPFGSYSPAVRNQGATTSGGVHDHHLSTTAADDDELADLFGDHDHSDRPSLLTPIHSRRTSAAVQHDLNMDLGFDRIFGMIRPEDLQDLAEPPEQPPPTNGYVAQANGGHHQPTSSDPNLAWSTPLISPFNAGNISALNNADLITPLSSSNFNNHDNDKGKKKDQTQQQDPLQQQQSSKPAKGKKTAVSAAAATNVSQPPPPQPAAVAKSSGHRFDFANLVVAEVCPEKLRENGKTLVVVGMGKLPETLNHRTWMEKVMPKLSVWMGEYRIPNVESIALGVLRFVCPPMFREAVANGPVIQVRCEGRAGPLSFTMASLPTWDQHHLPSAIMPGGDVKRVRPDLTAHHDSNENSPNILASLNSKRRFSLRSPMNANSSGAQSIFKSGRDNMDDDDVEEEEEEEEDLDRRATDMVERVVTLMMSSGGNPNLTEVINEVSADNGFNFLHTAVFCGASVEVIQMLLSNGADPNIKTRNAEGNSALHLACDQGNVAVAKALVAAGADVNLLNGQGCTPAELIMCREENEADGELFSILGISPPGPNSTTLGTTGGMQSPPGQGSTGGGANSTVMPASPLRGGMSPRPQTPLRQASGSISLAGDNGGGSHMALLREALSSLTLKEQYALAVAVNNSESTEKKTRRSGSIASSTGYDVASASPNMIGSATFTVGISSAAAASADAASDNFSLRSRSGTMNNAEGNTKNKGGDSVMKNMESATHGMEQEEPPHVVEEDDVARVVTENHSSVLAAMGPINRAEQAQLDADARKIQSNVRAWILRRQYKEIREATKKVQALAKGHLARRHFRELREKVSATLVIQKSLRAHIKSKRAKSAATTMLASNPDDAVIEDLSKSGMPPPQTTAAPPPQQQQPSWSSAVLNERRISTGTAATTVGGGEGQQHPDPAQTAADDFLLSSDDLFDVNMRDD